MNLRGWRHLAVVALAYTLIAAVMTWPLVSQLTRGLAADYADPLFNCWILMWTGGQLAAAIGGDPSALGRYWDGNIFHPAPITITYSEHLTPQMLQVLPVWIATDNMLLGYNLLFLSTFVLSAVAVYWLVRDLTGHRLAAFVAGLAFAYSPYRLGQLSHVQILSSQWMPLAILGYRRYFASGRLLPLAGGAAAWLVQNLSCGYYLLFFSPFLGAYWLFEMTRRRLLGQWRVWAALGGAAVVVALVTWPFVAPYLELREVTGIGSRAFSEIVSYSSDTHAFASAPRHTRLWGTRLEAYPKGEGIGFFGVTILSLAFCGLVAGMRASWVAQRGRALSRDRRVLLWIAGAVVIVSAGVFMWIGAASSLTIQIGSRSTMLRNVAPMLQWGGAGLAAFLILWPRAATGRSGAISPGVRFWLLAAICSALFALGPRIESAGHRIGVGPYFWLLEYVPGFDGLRVPSRFLMLTSLFLAVLAGLGAAALLPRHRMAARLGAALLGCGVLAEAWMAPMPVSVPLEVATLAPAPAPLAGRRISPLYQMIRHAPPDTVLIEFPFGDPAYDVPATYYAGHHRRPLVNGYSGFFPDDYDERTRAINGLATDPDAATAVLRASGATHALVHEGAYRNDAGRQVSAWLLAQGARQVGVHGSDRLFVLR